MRRWLLSPDHCVILSSLVRAAGSRAMPVGGVAPRNVAPGRFYLPCRNRLFSLARRWRAKSGVVTLMRPARAAVPAAARQSGWPGHDPWVTLIAGWYQQA